MEGFDAAAKTTGLDFGRVLAFWPFGGEQATWETQLTQSHVDGLTRYGLGPRYYRLLLVPEVLRKPVAIFQGWEREGHHESLCYVGQPARDYRSESIEVPPPPGMVFLVFVTAGGKISDWRWEKADPANSAYPEQFEERFARIVWPMNPPD